MRVRFVLFFFALAALPGYAQEDHSRDQTSFSTEGIYSQPYKRASFTAGWKNWVLTPGYASSEDRRFGFALAGYRFERKIEHGNGEVFFEPHAGLAHGHQLGNTAVFGARLELETHKWILASWIDSYRGKVNFTTCEPLAEASRHIGRGFFFGATASCYMGPANEAAAEREHGLRHETIPAIERGVYVGPMASWRNSLFLIGTAYEIGKRGDKYLSGYLSIIWH
ncbi:MAG: hypothetical protein HY918_04865 [Candidatus Doudnabacteria bacterium]|nr:hypothetical protein [Candidatus Doudnabacteria bacterium]